VQTNLVSDVPGRAAVTDPNLVNAWGIDFSATSPAWVADNGTGLATLYTGTGSIVPLVVTIPPPAGSEDTSAPTGLIFNGNGGFMVSSGGASGSAVFIFATEDGTISGWNPTVDLHNAILAVDNSGAEASTKVSQLEPPGTVRSFMRQTSTAVGWKCMTQISSG
jgi:uncharacterized protein (TIGR03118 family)